MYVMGFWKIFYFWNKSSLGNNKDIIYSNIFASNFNWYGCWRTYIYSAANRNHNGNCFIVCKKVMEEMNFFEHTGSVF